MLLSLQIKHFTIVDTMELDFCPGLSTFTGETGAGKSIMLDALELVLGGKSNSAIIRDGFDACSLTASFFVADNLDVQDWLVRQSIESDDELLLRRVIMKNGRSKSYLNGQLLPLQTIRELGLLLVNIHGQHQQQHLLKHDFHRIQLDSFGGYDDLLSLVAERYQHYHSIETALKQLDDSSLQSDKRELLAYQVPELQALDLTDGEVEQLGNEHKALSEAGNIRYALQQAIETLSGEADSPVEASLHQVMQQLSEIDSPSEALKNSQELVNSALIHTQEAVSELHVLLREAEEDPERLHEIDTRLSRIFDAARKHHVKAADLYAHQQALEAKLKALDDSQQQKEQLAARLVEAEKDYLVVANQLSTKRQAEAKLLARDVTKTIRQLGMPDGELTIHFTPVSGMRSHGIDRVEYFVAPNPGLAPQPLAKIGSGGELSRISLAIQVLTAEKKAYPTLIFDEVDVGIGGKTAATVGQLLRRLGNHTQVFCVTHQAQVASKANHHFYVEKSIHNGHTFSEVRRLTDDEKVDEIARMLGGVSITTQTLAHAKELLTMVGEVE